MLLIFLAHILLPARVRFQPNQRNHMICWKFPRSHDPENLLGVQCQTAIRPPTSATRLRLGMATSDSASDEFIHQLAIKLSRALNIIVPNDLLAQRVSDIAKTNSLDDFTKGVAYAGRCYSR